jgi:hypothetical protein
MAYPCLHNQDGINLQDQKYLKKAQVLKKEISGPACALNLTLSVLHSLHTLSWPWFSTGAVIKPHLSSP